ncbi:hypothetical protein FNF27_06512 [Cafeteria roenbergensis]|uniref:C2H2-type domain-containing protein n=1 Tax=Cafeteria roenbergensis TaxID=33653 RepID=A0A5A8DZA4_CAFRO|nr:hypothetical protein FNF27_06512 [Cafeteria roenbergensis]
MKHTRSRGLATQRRRGKAAAPSPPPRHVKETSFCGIHRYHTADCGPAAMLSSAPPQAPTTTATGAGGDPKHETRHAGLSSSCAAAAVPIFTTSHGVLHHGSSDLGQTNSIGGGPYDVTASRSLLGLWPPASRFPSQTSSETDGYQLRHVSSAEYGRRTVGADGAQGLGPLNTVGSVLSLGQRPSAHFGSLDRDSLAALKLPGNYGDSARHMTLQFRGSSRPFAYHDLGAPAYVQHHRRSESSGQFASINVPQPGQLRSTAAAARLAEAVWAPAADGSAAELGTRPGKRQRDDSEPLPSAQRLVRASAPWTAAAAAKTESAAVAPEDVSDASEEHDDDDTDGDFESMAKRRRPARSRAQSGGARRRRSSKDHACTYPGCTKVFKSNSDLAAHKRTHTGEKPLKCKYEGCNAAFAHSSNRRQHERSKHEKVKRYHCRFPGCKKEYAHPTSRNDHEAVKHRNERPYKCDRCGADFTARANLSRHKSGGDCKAPVATPALPATTVGSEAKPQLSTS